MEEEKKKASTTAKKSAPKKAGTVKKTTTTKKSTVKKAPAAKKDNLKDEKPVKSTKKTAPKKETEVKAGVSKEEVKIEATGSFCRNCGKKLAPGEKCDCMDKKEQPINIDTDAIVEKGKNLFDILINVYKKPFSTCKEETEKTDVKNGLSFIVLIALSLGLLITSLTYAAFHINVGPFGDVSKYYHVSYFKIFVVWSVVSIVLAVIPIIIAYLANKLFSKSKFDFSNSINLYANTMSVVIIVNVISAIFIFAGLFVKFFLLVSLAAMLFGYINYLLVYKNIMEFDQNKEPYIILGIIIAWILMAAIICSLFTSGVDGLNAFNTIFSTMNN